MYESAIVNKAGGLAFRFEDPAEYLLATIGSAMFTEPKYYKDTENLNNTSIDGIVSVVDDEQAVKIINACTKVCQGDNPRDVLALARWARTELKMRTTPQIMLAIAAKYNKSKPFVRKYVPLISQRADEIKQVVAAYEHLYGRKGFPACLKKGVSDRISTMSEYEILKYNNKIHPTFADILKFCERKKGYPVSKEMREYIVKGEVLNTEVTPIIAARKELTLLKKWNNDVPMLAKKAVVTWEVLLSKFGNKPEVWEAVIPQMGYMALLRNIANFLDANISLDVVKSIVDILSDKDRVIKSKQLPFRFLSARRDLYPEESDWYLCSNRSSEHDRDSWDKRKMQLFLDAIEIALDYSVINVPKLPGITCIAADNSDSMSIPISEKSSIIIKDAANVLCSIVHKCCEESYICAFGNNVVWPPITKRNSVLTNMQQIATYMDSYRGHSTNAWKVFDYLLEKNIYVDRIIVLSDMQCYDSCGNYGDKNSSVAERLKKYRKVINNNCYAHFFDLQGYGSRQTPSKDPLVNVVAGFSEKIFDQVLIHEGINVVDGNFLLPSLNYIRENY